MTSWDIAVSVFNAGPWLVPGAARPRGVAPIAPPDPNRTSDNWQSRFNWRIGKLMAKRLLGAAVAGAASASPASMFAVVGGVEEYSRNSSGQLVDSRGDVVKATEEMMQLFDEAANRVGSASCFGGAGVNCAQSLIDCMEGTGDAVRQCKAAMADAAAWTTNAETTVENMNSTSLVSLPQKI